MARTADRERGLRPVCRMEAICAKMSRLSGQQQSHTQTRKDLDGPGPSQSHAGALLSLKIARCITTVTTVTTVLTVHNSHSTAQLPGFPVCGELLWHIVPPNPPSPIPYRRHFPVPSSTTRGDRCPVQHGTVRHSLCLQQLATTGQTWRALRLLPSSNRCIIRSRPWLLVRPRSNIPAVIVERVFSPAASAEEPRFRTAWLPGTLVPRFDS